MESTTGAISVYRYGTTTLTTQFSANSTIPLIYDGTAWYVNGATNTDTYDRVRHSNAITAAAAISASRIIVGTSAGYRMAAAGVAFDIGYPVLWATAAIAANATATTAYSSYPSCTLRNNKSGITLTKGSSAYLVGTLAGSTFTIGTAVLANAPSSADGLQYVPVGVLYSTYQVYFEGGMPTVWEYGANGFAPMEVGAAADAAQALETALDGAHLVISSSNGQLFKNGSESTVLQVAVFPNGGGRIDTMAGGRARFGAGAYVEWRWKHEDSGTWGTVVSTDPHLGQDGMQLTVTPSDVDTKTTFEASLVIPD